MIIWLLKMKNRFSAFKRIRPHKPRSSKNASRVDMSFYNRSLFPVNIDPRIRGMLINSTTIPQILLHIFDQHGITYIGQLQGLKASAFCSWYGVGAKYFKALCSFLDSLLSDEVKKLYLQESEQAIRTANLPTEILVFPIEKLNIPTLVKSHLKTQIGLETVQDFLNEYENGRLFRPVIGLRTVQFVFKEIVTLCKISPENYSGNVNPKK